MRPEPMVNKTRCTRKSEETEAPTHKAGNLRWWPELHPRCCTVDPRLTSQVDVILPCITSLCSYQPMKIPGCQGLATVKAANERRALALCFLFLVLHGNGRKQSHHAGCCHCITWSFESLSLSPSRPVSWIPEDHSGFRLYLSLPPLDTNRKHSCKNSPVWFQFISWTKCEQKVNSYQSTHICAPSPEQTAGQEVKQLTAGDVVQSIALLDRVWRH